MDLTTTKERLKKAKTGDVETQYSLFLPIQIIDNICGIRSNL